MPGKFASGQLLHLRLFLEGIEVPVISATVTAQIGSPAAAQIEIIATDRALELLPRTTVHVFYLDYEKAQYEGSGISDVRDDNIQELIDDGLPETPWARERDTLYHLLFSGEIFSYSFSKSGVGQRSVVLQCLDFSNVWDTHYLYNLRYSAVDPGDGQGSFVAGNQVNFLATASPFDDVVNYPELVVAKLAGSRRVANNPALTGTTDIVGSLFAVLELLGGVQGKHFGINAWTTIQERRTRLMDQLAGDSGSTATKLYEQSVFESWLTDKLGGQGGVISFRDVIRTINSYIYYDVVPNPVGRYKPGSRDVPNWATIDELLKSEKLIGIPVGQTGTLIGINPLTGVFSRSGREALAPYFLEKLDQLEKKLVEEKGWSGPSGSAKPRPFEASLIRNGSAYAKGMHGLGHAADLGIDGVSSGFTGKGGMYATFGKSGYNNLAFARRDTYGRMHYHLRFGGVNSPLKPEDQSIIDKLALFYKDIEAVANEVGLYWGGYFGGAPQTDETGTWTSFLSPEDNQTTLYEYVWRSKGMGWDPIHVQTKGFSREQIRADLAAGVLTGIEKSVELAPIQGNGVSVDATPSSSTLAEERARNPRERLITQVFRPDVWFVPPPACNIIFPEEYQSFTFSRQMMREVTRLQLTTFNALYEDAIVNQYYFAPSFRNVESLSEHGIGSAAKSLIYPHEKFSGVIPKMERISEVSFYSKLSANALNPLAGQVPATNAEIQAGIESLGNNGEEGNPVNVIENYAGRVAAYNFLTHRYSSRTANMSGRFMPRVVCGWPALIVNRPRTGFSDPTHFLGLVVSFSHSLNQGGGNTSLTMTHARSHRTGNRTDDLFSKELLGRNGLLSIQTLPGDIKETVIEVTEGLSEKDKRWLATANDLLLADLNIEKDKIQTGTIKADPRTWGLKNPPPMTGPAGLGDLIEVEIAEEDRLLPPNPGRTTLDLDESGNTDFRSYRFLKATFRERGIAGILPLEEAIRPPWFSNEYANDNIGTLYKELYGCPALVDVRANIETNETTVSIEKATDALVDDYTEAEDGQTANAYIYGTTRREYATLPEVLNGFHYQSYANTDNGGGTNLEGLDIVGGVKLTIQHGRFEEQQIKDDAAARLDPRKERAQRVTDYLNELLISRGLRG